MVGNSLLTTTILFFASDPAYVPFSEDTAVAGKYGVAHRRPGAGGRTIERVPPRPTRVLILGRILDDQRLQYRAELQGF
jgi:hypothetical protein